MRIFELLSLLVLIFDLSGGEVIDKRAVIWRIHHPRDTPCDGSRRRKCPLCILLPCLNKLGKIASHPALLQSDPHSLDTAKQQEIRQFAREALTPELLEAIGECHIVCGSCEGYDLLNIGGCLDYVLRQSALVITFAKSR